jgi:hypothetical protein
MLMVKKLCRPKYFSWPLPISTFFRVHLNYDDALPKKKKSHSALYPQTISLARKPLLGTFPSDPSTIV